MTAPNPAKLTALRYRADGPEVYVHALLQLVKLARDSADEFTFGPLALSDCERDGLSVTGPDLAGPIAVLSLVPGLAKVDDGDTRPG